MHTLQAVQLALGGEGDSGHGPPRGSACLVGSRDTRAEARAVLCWKPEWVPRGLGGVGGVERGEGLTLEGVGGRRSQGGRAREAGGGQAWVVSDV